MQITARTEAERAWQCLSEFDPSYLNILYDGHNADRGGEGLLAMVRLRGGPSFHNILCDAHGVLTTARQCKLGSTDQNLTHPTVTFSINDQGVKTTARTKAERHDSAYRRLTHPGVTFCINIKVCKPRVPTTLEQIGKRW